MTLILTEGFETITGEGGTSGIDINAPFNFTCDQLRTTLGRTGYGTRHYIVGQPLTALQEHDTLVCGFAARRGYDTVAELCGFYSDSGATNHVNLYRNVGGTLSLRRGTTVLATSTVPLHVQTVWHYYELKAKLSDTVGTIELRMDGNPNPVLSFSGDTKNGGTKTVFDYLRMNGQNFHQLDDVYLLNGDGSSPTNDFLGEVAIYALAPNGDGDINQGVGSDGNSVSNYLLVDEPSVNSTAADYVDIANDGDMDLYNLTNLLATTGNIISVRTGLHVAKDVAGTKSARTIIKTNGSIYSYPDIVLATSYQKRHDWSDLNPITGLPWTFAEINALQAGFEARP